MADDPFDFQKSNRLDYESKLPGAKTEAQKRALWGEYRGNMKATNPDVDIPEYDKAQKAPTRYAKGGQVGKVGSFGMKRSKPDFGAGGPIANRKSWSK